jgi:hypothetical protein
MRFNSAKTSPRSWPAEVSEARPERRGVLAQLLLVQPGIDHLRHLAPVADRVIGTIWRWPLIVRATFYSLISHYSIEAIKLG